MATLGVSHPKRVRRTHHADSLLISAHVSPPTFDLESWAGNYDGALLPLRLAHVALRCPSLATQSLTIAIAAAKRGKDVAQYTRLCEFASQAGQPRLGTPDMDWVNRQEEGNRRELQRLESELRGYKNNLIRESIRMGQEELATHHLLTGGPPPDPKAQQSSQSSGYGAAYQAFAKMRDYCTTPTHVASMTLRLTFTALVQAISAQQLTGHAGLHYGTVQANAARLRVSGVKEEEQSKLTPIASAASGLAYLGQGSYRDAAGAFLQMSFDYHTLGTVHGTEYARAMAAANDIAVYGGLCALATLDRQQLQDTVLGGPFRQFLELEPHMRKAISLFTTAKYQACLGILQHYYSDWSLDIFLGSPAKPSGSETASHIDRLLAMVREKSITAYLASFSEVSLAALAATFPPISATAASIETEVLNMIRADTLKARLDTVNKVLIIPQIDTRAATQADAKQTADDIERTLLLRLHRVNVSLAGLEVPRPKAGPGGPWEGAHNGAYPDSIAS